jgi:ATP-dependent Clp protease ATP-binding subunit ClpC
MYIRLTDRAVNVMHLANQEAVRLQHEYVGTEHLVLGVVAESSGNAIVVLRKLRVEPQRVRLEVEKIVQPGPEPAPTGRLPLTPRAKKVFEFAITGARDLNHEAMGTEDLLVGLLLEEQGVAGQILMNLGLTLDDVRDEVARLTEREAVTDPKQ